MIKVRPAIFVKSFGCQVQPPQPPEFRTLAFPPTSPEKADGVVIEFCDLENAVLSKAMGTVDGQENFLLNWRDAKNLCYSILKAAAETGDLASQKCLAIIADSNQEQK